MINVGQFLIKQYKDLHCYGDPWMAPYSQNDPDILGNIVDFSLDTPVIYVWNDIFNWTSLNIRKISGRVNGQYRDIRYDEISNMSSFDSDSRINVDQIEFYTDQNIGEKISMSLNNLLLEQRK